MGREENIEIFKDTEKLCKTNETLKKAVAHSNALQSLILEGDVLEGKMKRYEEEAKVIVSKKRTFEAASAYRNQKTAVLNFASATNPGGGVVHGSNAQEECLCRCSALYFSLNTDEMWNGFYKPHRKEGNPIHNDDVIYTPEVVVFKTDTSYPRLMPETEWYKANVITCAAPNLREKPQNRMNPGDGNVAVKITEKQLLELHEKRLRRILGIAALDSNEAVVLGAFGCGAFQNPPQIVALAVKNVIREYLHAFKIIEAAVYCTPKDDTNFKVFNRVLSVYNK